MAVSVEGVTYKVEAITEERVSCILMEYGHEGETKVIKATAFLAKARHIRSHQTVFKFDDSMIALNKASAMVSAAIALTQYHIFTLGYDMTQKVNWSESLELLKDPIQVRALKAFKEGRLKIPIGCCLCIGGASGERGQHVQARPRPRLPELFVHLFVSMCRVCCCSSAVV
mgnify:CR=1 FL=1